jgi:nitrate reductase gamma subunit
MAEDENGEVVENWRAKTLFMGAALGALVGIGAAYLIVQRAEREAGKVRITAGDGVKLGLLVFGLLRQVAQLGEGEK